MPPRACNDHPHIAPIVEQIARLCIARRERNSINRWPSLLRSPFSSLRHHGIRLPRLAIKAKQIEAVTDSEVRIYLLRQAIGGVGKPGLPANDELQGSNLLRAKPL